MKKYLLVAVLAFVLGLLFSELVLHGVLAGNQIGCSFDPLPFHLDFGWLDSYCGA